MNVYGTHSAFTSRGGFTLVELLVVITVIALLLSILLPVLTKARQYAQCITCSNILRNISQAHKLHLADTGTYLPHTSYAPYTPWFNNDHLRKTLALPELTNEQKERRTDELQEWQPNIPREFICPAASFALKNSEKGLYPMERSYGVNIDGDYYARKKGLVGKLKEDWVKRPSDKIFIADALDWWISYYFCHLYQKYGENFIGIKTYGMTAYRHLNDKTNIVYWDGHCGRLKSKEVMNSPQLWDPLE